MFKGDADFCPFQLRGWTVERDRNRKIPRDEWKKNRGRKTNEETEVTRRVRMRKRLAGEREKRCSFFPESPPNVVNAR